VSFYLVVNKLADIGVFLCNEIKSQRPKNLEYWKAERSEQNWFLVPENPIRSRTTQKAIQRDFLFGRK
jgi:hypothetical protein